MPQPASSLIAASPPHGLQESTVGTASALTDAAQKFLKGELMRDTAKEVPLPQGPDLPWSSRVRERAPVFPHLRKGLPAEKSRVGSNELKNYSASRFVSTLSRRPTHSHVHQQDAHE
jgi:hypothetical protein